MMENENITPQINERGVQATMNPIQMRGLCHVLSTSYQEGMSINDLQIEVATAVQKELMAVAQTLDPQSAEVVMKYLQSVDYRLTNEYNKEVRSGKKCNKLK